MLIHLLKNKQKTPHKTNNKKYNSPHPQKTRNSSKMSNKKPQTTESLQPVLGFVGWNRPGLSLHRNFMGHILVWGK